MSIRETTLDDLATFIQIVDSGGFTAAARVLDRSTQRVSRQLRRLEAQLDARLLHRTTQSISLTEPGREVYAHAIGLLTRADQLEQALLLRHEGLVGVLRVAIPGLDIGVVEWIREIRSENPGVRFRLTVSDIPLDLAAKGLDLQLVIRPPSQTSFRIRSLGAAPTVLAAHRAYRATRPSPEEPDELSEHDALLWTADGQQTTWTLVRDDGTRAVIPVAGPLQSDDSGLLHRALLGGLGIGPVGERFLADRGPELGLVRVLPRWHFEPARIYAIVPPAAAASPLRERFIEEVRRGLARWF